MTNSNKFARWIKARPRHHKLLMLVSIQKIFISSNDLQKMYRGIVESQFSYCCSIWGFYGEFKLNSLQKIQNRAARIVTNSSYDASAAPLLQSICCVSSKDFIWKETVTLTYRLLNSLAPPQYLIE